MKKCFKCKKVKPLDQFYKHAQMADGHVNKCIDCNKKDVKDNYDLKITDPAFIEKERKRGRSKFHRLYAGKIKGGNPVARLNWKNKFPEKEATRKLNCHRLVSKGFEAHHWSYSLEHQLNVIPLTKKHHMKAHRFLIYDQERMMYRRYDTNELLDTKEKHEQFILWCIDSKDD